MEDACKKDAISRRSAFFLILAPLLCALVLPTASMGGPIFPDQYLHEKPLPQTPEIKKKTVHILVKNPGKIRARRFRMDLDDGLEAGEAAVLAAIINPVALDVRKEKGLETPQLMESGVLAPPTVHLDREKARGDFWLPGEKLNAIRETIVRLRQHRAGKEEIELESAWLEWQASEAARLYIYRRANSRKVIDLLREIKKVYRDIYKTGSRKEYREKYSDRRAIALVGYEKMKGAIRREEKALGAARVGLDHALGLPTYLEVPVQLDASFVMPREIPGIKDLVGRLSERRLDLMALQYGVMKKDPELMGYILSKFKPIETAIMERKKAEWLDTARAGVDIDFPLLSGMNANAGLEASDGKTLFKEFQRRSKNAGEDISRLWKGIGFLREELTKVGMTLPSLNRAANDAAKGKDKVAALEKKKTLLAVKLLRLRLRRKLIDAVMALDLTSGRIMAPDHTE